MPDDAPETTSPDVPATTDAPPSLAPVAPTLPPPSVDAAPVTDHGDLARVDAFVAGASPATDSASVTATLAAVAALPPAKRAALAPMVDAAEKIAAIVSPVPAPEVPPPYARVAGVRCPVSVDVVGPGRTVVTVRVGGVTVTRAAESPRVALAMLAREVGEVVE